MAQSFQAVRCQKRLGATELQTRDLLIFAQPHPNGYFKDVFSLFTFIVQSRLLLFLEPRLF